MSRGGKRWGTSLRPLALRALGEDPLVSILIANYNYARFLRAALDSALEQTYRRVEIVVCDDGSTDASREILREYAESCLNVKVLLQENKGQAGAILAAYGASSGEIVCLLDADDLFDAMKVEKVVRAFELAPASGFLVHRLAAADGALGRLRTVPAVAELASGWKGPGMSAEAPQMLWGMAPTSGLALRREVAERVMPHLEGRRVFADSVIQVLAPLLTPIVAVEQTLGLYRIHGENAYGLRKFSVADLEKLSFQDNELWQAWRSFVLEIARGSASGVRIPAADVIPVSRYAHVRRRGDANWREVYQETMAGPWFASMHWPYRWFWRLSAVFPDWLFRRSFDFIYGKGRTKAVFSRMMQGLRALKPTLQRLRAEARGD